jgi:uncharacterized protein (DUF362 family)
MMKNILYSFECFLRRKISRGTFLKFCLGWLLVLVSESKLLKAAFAQGEQGLPRIKKEVVTPADLVSVAGSDPYKNTVAAIDALGGMSLFVSPGSVVVVKPNIGWDRTPEQAANTDPAVVAALVDLSYKAGAKRVNVFDVTCNDARRCYANSGIEAAATAKGAKVYFADSWNVVKAHFPYKSPMEGWTLLRDAVMCDTFINVPVLKHHGLTDLTLSMKNLMGICTGMRGIMHVDIATKLVDLTDFIKPDLTVIDATRVLMRNGPSGGNLADVEKRDTVFASTDPVLADAYACQLVKKDPLSIGYIAEAARRKMGTADVANAKIKTLTI